MPAEAPSQGGHAMHHARAGGGGGNSSSGAGTGRGCKVRVAVIGTGISGLCFAWLVSNHARSRYDVTLFERADTLGMDQASHSCYGARLDVPLRTFSLDYYANLAHIYHTIGVPYEMASYSLSIREAVPAQSRVDTYFRYVNSKSPLARLVFGMQVVSYPGFAQWFSLRSWRLIFSLIRFGYRARAALNDGSCEGLTFREYCTKFGFGELLESTLLPILCVVCTCSWRAVSDYPAEVLIDYFVGRRILGSPQMRALEGSRDVVARLSSSCNEIRTSTDVLRVAPCAGPDGKHQVTVEWRDQSGAAAEAGGQTQTQSETFDEVVFATQANAVLDLLGASATPEERSVLGAFAYERNRTILHTDASLMPGDKAQWSTVNMLVFPEKQESECTIWMNNIDETIRSQLTRNVFQSWNPVSRDPEPGSVVVDAEFERPVVTLATERAAERLELLQGRRHLWYIGAYSLYSMPLLENGVRSSIRVARSFGVFWPEAGRQLGGAAFEKRHPELVREDFDIHTVVETGNSSRGPLGRVLRAAIGLGVVGASVAGLGLAVGRRVSSWSA